MGRTLILVALGAVLLAPWTLGDSFVHWETPHVHPLCVPP